MNMEHRRKRLALVAALLAVFCVFAASLGLAQGSSTAQSPEEQVISDYETAGPSVVNITSLSYVYYRFLGNVP